MPGRAADAEFWNAVPQLAARLAGTAGAQWAGQQWAEAGQMEHASIASFAKFSLDLLGLGAPPDLIERAHLAAIDETHHARITWAIAKALSGEPLGPGPLDVADAAMRPSDMERVVREAFLDGCVGETYAAARAELAASETTDPALGAALAVIVRDEGLHADLAWSFVAWALQVGGHDVREAITLAFETARRELSVARPVVQDAPHFPGYGLLSAEQARSIERQVFERVVEPGFRHLIG